VEQVILNEVKNLKPLGSFFRVDLHAASQHHQMMKNEQQVIFLTTIY